MNFFSRTFKTKLCYSINVARHVNVDIKNGPDLREFLATNITNKITDEEIIANKLLLNTFSNGAEQITSHIKRKVFFEVHGCQMNTNDTEVAYSILNETNQYERTQLADEADVILINTCSIRENAETKVWNRLKNFHHLKKKRPHLQIGVLGCMAERLKEKIIDHDKLVDVICGPDSYRSLPSLLDESYRSGSTAMNVQLSLMETYAEINPIRINKNERTAFVSIQRGCA